VFRVHAARSLVAIVIVVNTAPIINKGKFRTGRDHEAMISGSPSPRHGASSGCGWRNGLQIWRVAANILNKQSRTADKGGPPAWGLGEVLTTPHRKELIMLLIIHRGFGIGLILWYDPSNGKGI
jgi:hypothetical protein